MVRSYQTHFVSCGNQVSKTAYTRQDTESSLPQELIGLAVVALPSAIIHPFYFRETCEGTCTCSSTHISLCVSLSIINKDT